MGTRNLTVVYDQHGELRVAQYCQWDGYPRGQGLTALNALPDLTSEMFEELTWATDKEISDLWKKVGVKDGYASIAQSDKFKEQHPELHRDTGAKVLTLIALNPRLKLHNDLAFAGDGLMCEWVYVIDFKTRMFEVYEGFKKRNLKKGRFYALKQADNEYAPVQLRKSWSLDALPTEEEFLKLQ